MATFSQGFLANLGRPAMTESLFDLGTAVGRLPGQYKGMKQREAAAAELAKYNQGSPEFFEALSRQAIAAGDTVKGAQYASQAAELRRRAVVAAREDEKYKREERERRDLTETEISQTMFQLDRLQSFIDSGEATDDQKTAAQNLKRAIGRAGDKGGVTFAGQVDSLLAGKSYDADRYTSIGKYAFDKRTGKFIRPDGSEEDNISAKDIAALQEKYIKQGYAPENVFKAVTNEGVINLALLGEKEEEEKEEGGISSASEKKYIEIAEQATDASVALSRNQSLVAQLSTDEGYYAGFANQLKTDILGFAGLRDASEEAKTAYIRSRNENLVKGLPAGVASDKDIELVKKGLPPDDAGKDEIIRYLQAESRILQARMDLAILTENHLVAQQSKGKEATIVGLEGKKTVYGTTVRAARRNIEAAREQGEQAYALEIERQKKYLEEVVGFVPAYFREL